MIEKYAKVINFFRKMGRFQKISQFRVLKEMTFHTLLQGGKIHVCVDSLCPTLTICVDGKISIEIVKVEDVNGNSNFVQAIIYQKSGRGPITKEKITWTFSYDQGAVTLKKQKLDNKIDVYTSSIQVSFMKMKAMYGSKNEAFFKKTSYPDQVSIDVDSSFFQSEYVTKLEKMVGIEIAHQLRKTKYPEMPMDYQKVPRK